MAELIGVDEKLAELARDWAAARLSRGEWDAARDVLKGLRDALQRRVDAGRRQVGLGGLPDPLRAAWPTLELHRRRAVVSALVEAVVIGPAVRGRNFFDAGRVSIRWRV